MWISTLQSFLLKGSCCPKPVCCCLLVCSYHITSSPLKHPVVALPPTLGTTTALQGTYLAIMVDPNAGTPSDVVEVLHYMLPGLTSSNTSTTRNNTTFYPLTTVAQPLAPYLVPAPTPGNAHSYTLTLWTQPDGFKVPSSFLSYLPLNALNLTNRYPFNLTSFVTAAGLGQPLAGGYFDLQNTTGSTATAGHSTSVASSTATGKTAATSSSAASKDTGDCVTTRYVISRAWALLAVVSIATWM